MRLINVLLMRTLKVKYLIIFSFCMLPTTIGMFITALIFSTNYSVPIFTYRNLEIPLALAMRTFCIAWVSFVFIIHINFTNSVLYAMQYLKLPVKIGYALFAMINAITHIKAEFFRIRIAQKMRAISSINPLNIIYPLLISASRYAYVCGISLEARGLNAQKSFVRQSPRWRKCDSIILIINILLLGVCIYFDSFANTF